MKLITNKSQLINNLNSLENYLAKVNDESSISAQLLIKRGTCFVAYEVDNEIRFAPSRFIGYKNNKLIAHSKSMYKDGRETNKAISAILSQKPRHNSELNLHYLTYCRSLGFHPNEKGAYGVERKFWNLELPQDFDINIDFSEGFPEGRMVERIHKSRERNSELISRAKERFKKEHGRVFCQICNFDFEKKYGDVGVDFIEAHHVIPVSEIPENYKTRIEDIAMLCSNCHRMVHRKRPWMSMQDLKKFIK
ncbi:MAG: HNH endonuclease [Bacteroidia bacterium]|jgi:5-methylcytosine-specific restriction protein A|nr:HNH endonuclease [Bacteroidia bacterium]